MKINEPVNPMESGKIAETYPPMIADQFEAAFFTVQDCQNEPELNMVINKIKQAGFTPRQLEELTRQIAAKMLDLYAKRQFQNN